MNLILDFPKVCPLSANKMHDPVKFRGGSIGKRKSELYKAYTTVINNYMRKYRFECSDFETSYSPYDHFLTCTIMFEVPRHKLFTKKNAISKTSIDVDNIQKPLLDLVFKHFQTIDDSFICNLDSHKVCSLTNEYRTVVILKKRNIEELTRPDLYLVD